MATYTLYCGALRPGMPGSFDGIEYYYPAACDALMIGENDTIEFPGDYSENQSGGILQLSSTEPIETGDDQADFRRKILGNLQPQYPQISWGEDTVNIVWL